MGRTLQRLFSTFPNGWPGAGLLLLRLCLGIPLLCFGVAGLSARTAEPAGIIQNLSQVAGGISLIAGLWTPVMGTLIALDEVWISASLDPGSQRDDMRIRIFLAVLAASLAMLGPGAWSVDARLFGRKRFDLDRTKGRKL